MIRDENGSLASIVFVDVAGVDLGTYVQKAKALIKGKVKLPAGYSLQWAGQYQYLERAEQQLQIVIPLTIFLIFVLLRLHNCRPSPRRLDLHPSEMKTGRWPVLFLWMLQEWISALTCRRPRP